MLLAGPALPPERGKTHFNALKRQRQTFRLARHDLERWKQEETLLRNLHDAQERASAAERDTAANERLVEQRQKHVRMFIVYEGVLQAYGTKRKVDLLQKRLAAFENEREGQTNMAISDKLEGENRSLEEICLRYRDRASKLQGEVRNIRKVVLRAPGRRVRLG